MKRTMRFIAASVIEVQIENQTFEVLEPVELRPTTRR